MASAAEHMEAEEYLNGEGLDDRIVFPNEVQDAINDVLPSSDALDKSTFNVVDYINNLFPTEQSLANIDDVVVQIQAKIRRLNDDIGANVRGQSGVAVEGKEALSEAQKSIAELFIKIRDIKEKAEKSEEMVKEITRDIKQLDHAKKNLTTSITTLNHLHFLVSGIEQLKSLSKSRQYGEVANLLEGVGNVLEHFEKYMHIPHIKQFHDRVTELKTELGHQIQQDFEDALQGPAAKYGPSNQNLLKEACFVVNLLEASSKKKLLSWFVKLQLEEYFVLYAEDQDISWLDKIDRRFAWLKRSLVEFEEKFGGMFPPSWEVSERICVGFCEHTRESLKKIMARRVQEIDVKLLLFAIQKTTNFESLCSKRFAGRTLNPEKALSQVVSPVTPTNPFEESTNPFASDMEPETVPIAPPAQSPSSPFLRIISKCFENHLNIYIDSQKANLSDLIERFVADFRENGCPQYEGEADSNILSSCADLFVYYKKCMVQCCQLSSGMPMIHLTATFQVYLREYANKLLMANLPKAPSPGQSISASGLIQSILKEGDSGKLNESEQARVCSILCTAEYCLETTQQLEDKLKEKVDVALKEKINMSTEQNTFHQVISHCITILVQDLELSCEPSLTAMHKLSWHTFETVGDQSSYVSKISMHLRQNLPVIRDNLSGSRKYFTQFCIKFVSSFIPKFNNNLYKCKNVSTAGAEQLLLDTHSLKTILLNLPSLGSQIDRKAPTSFTKIVAKGMMKAEMVLKTVMSSHEDPNAYVESFFRLLQENELNDFQKILEMKGLRRADQVVLLEIYRKKAHEGTSAVGGSAASSVRPSSSSHAPAGQESRIRRLEQLIKKQL